MTTADADKAHRGVEAAREWLARKRRASHPSGSFDKSKRWTPSDEERQDCCSRIRAPSAAYPYSMMTHCRTAEHVAMLFGVDKYEMMEAAPFVSVADGIVGVSSGV